VLRRAGFFVAALLGILSFPPLGLWPLAYVAMVPFLAAAVDLSPRRAFRRAYLAGFVFFSAILYWIGLNSGAPVALSAASAVAVVAVLSTVWAITAWAVAKTAARVSIRCALIVFVSLYMFFEVFWGTGEIAFPWAVWGLTQTRCLPALQAADLGDIYGLSLWVLSLNALAFLLWHDRDHRRRLGWIFALVFLVPIVYGIVRLATFVPGESVSVAAVQANTPAEEKWQMAAEDIARSYIETTKPLTGTGTRLVVWPETATPTPLRFRPWLRDALDSLCNSTGMTLLTGATDYSFDSSRGWLPYNAAFLVRPGTPELLSSAKIHLVPFGERIPGQKWFPFLNKLHLGQAEWVPGKEVVVFPAQNGVPPLGCLICFEVVFPDLAADMVMRGARLLTTITNDGWYGNSSGPYQHLDLARLRAVAVRRSMVRSANTGISALIDPTGRVTERLGYNRVGSIHGTLPAYSGITLAARLAHWWLRIYTALLIAMLFVLWIKSGREHSAQHVS
jgi:apolipoprotein N-acyltransferase